MTDQDGEVPDRRKAVLGALSRFLNFDEEQADLEAEAHWLEVSCVMALIEGAPGMQDSGTREDLKALRALYGHLVAVHDITATLPKGATVTLQAAVETEKERRRENQGCGIYQRIDHVRDPRALGIEAGALAFTVYDAYRRIDADANPKKVWKPRKIAALKIACRARDVCERLTDKHVTVITEAHEPGHAARGPFLELVTALFEIFGVDASPETFARRAVRDREDR